MGPAKDALAEAWQDFGPGWYKPNDGDPEPDGTEWMRELQDVEIPAGRVRPTDSPLVVYFIQSEHGGPIKIGTSRLGGVRSRLKSLQGGNPERLVILRLVLGGPRLEKRLHRQFASDRVRPGCEWFNPSPFLAAVSLAP